MNIIAKNPYRYLGVYSNSPTKERVANKGKMNAFLKVGKSVSFPLDLPYILPSIERTIETIANAESEPTLPTDQIRFAQFWWMNATPLDGIAFNHLINGNMNMAQSIWEKKMMYLHFKIAFYFLPLIMIGALQFVMQRTYTLIFQKNLLQRSLVRKCPYQLRFGKCSLIHWLNQVQTFCRSWIYSPIQNGKTI